MIYKWKFQSRSPPIRSQNDQLLRFPVTVTFSFLWPKEELTGEDRIHSFLSFLFRSADIWRGSIHQRQYERRIQTKISCISACDRIVASKFQHFSWKEKSINRNHRHLSCYLYSSSFLIVSINFFCSKFSTQRPQTKTKIHLYLVLYQRDRHSS